MKKPVHQGDHEERGAERAFSSCRFSVSPVFSVVRTHLSSLLALVLLVAALPALPADFDLFLKSDYGAARFSLNTRTGEFRWEDKQKNLDVTGKGELHFPSMGPIVFSFAGPLEGYDWVSVSLKIYGTTATGSMAAYPAGEKVRKLVSNFYDRNTEDDWPRAKAPKKKPAPPPEVGTIRPVPGEVGEGGTVP